MILITVRAKLNAENRDRALAAARAMSAHSLSEPGCLDYRLWLSSDDPTSVLLLEQWEDQAALDAHLSTPQLAEFATALGSSLDGGMTASKFEVSSAAPLL